MEAAVQALYTPHVQQLLAQAANVPFLNWQALGDFENYVYRVDSAQDPHILRVVHSSHRTANQILAELDWLQFLAQHEVPIANALPLPDGNLIATATAADGSTFHLNKFTVAPGAAPPTQWTPAIIENIGRLVGRMHRVTQQYQAPSAAVKRLTWSEEPYFKHGAQWLDPAKPKLKAAWQTLMQTLAALPTDPTRFGLIHGDVHGGNFFVQDEAVTLFDFDDCSYKWFASDIAVVFFYAAWRQADAEKEAYMATFAGHFWRGYNTENTLPADQLELLSTFLDLRRILLYTVVQHKFDAENMPERIKAMLIDFEHGIVTNTPVLPLDVLLP